MHPSSRIPRRILAGFLAADFLFVGVYFALLQAGMGATRLFRMFNLDLESNPPAWFSAAQLLVIALVLYVLAAKPFAEHPRLRPLRGGFLGLGMLFTYLSLDEGGVVHERLSDLLGRGWYVPALHGRGLVVGGLLLAAVSVSVFGTWRYALPGARLWPKQVLMFLAGCCLILAGGIFSELVVRALDLHFAQSAVFVEVGLEELAEMIGGSLILFAVTSVLASAGRDIMSLVLPAAESPAADVRTAEDEFAATEDAGSERLPG